MVRWKFALPLLVIGNRVVGKLKFALPLRVKLKFALPLLVIENRVVVFH
jgi:hypothetical protein